MSPSTLARLEELGPVAVAKLLAQHEYGLPGSDMRADVESWLRSKDLEASARKEAREDESLSISRKALANSERATRIAISAIVLSISMAIFSIIKWYSML
jgi:hypothetical protein